MKEFKNRNLRRVGLTLVVIYMLMGCLVPPALAAVAARAGNPIISCILVVFWIITLVLFLIITIFA